MSRRLVTLTILTTLHLAMVGDLEAYYTYSSYGDPYYRPTYTYYSSPLTYIPSSSPTSLPGPSLSTESMSVHQNKFLSHPLVKIGTILCLEYGLYRLARYLLKSYSPDGYLQSAHQIIQDYEKTGGYGTTKSGTVLIEKLKGLDPEATASQLNKIFFKANRSIRYLWNYQHDLWRQEHGFAGYSPSLSVQLRDNHPLLKARYHLSQEYEKLLKARSYLEHALSRKQEKKWNRGKQALKEQDTVETYIREIQTVLDSITSSRRFQLQNLSYDYQYSYLEANKPASTFAYASHSEFGIQDNIPELSLSKEGFDEKLDELHRMSSEVTTQELGDFDES